jgi:hypothetical protein
VSTCAYLHKQGSASAPYVLITFTVAPEMTPALLHDSLDKGQHSLKAVPGVGDAAYAFAATTGGTGLTFLSGTVVCSIYTPVKTTTTAKATLAGHILGG